VSCCQILLGSGADVPCVGRCDFLVHVFHAHPHCQRVHVSQAEVSSWQMNHNSRTPHTTKCTHRTRVKFK
jgi:hypothetical protein